MRPRFLYTHVDCCFLNNMIVCVMKQKKSVFYHILFNAVQPSGVPGRLLWVFLRKNVVVQKRGDTAEIALHFYVSFKGSAVPLRHPGCMRYCTPRDSSTPPISRTCALTALVRRNGLFRNCRGPLCASSQGCGARKSIKWIANVRCLFFFGHRSCAHNDSCAGPCCCFTVFMLFHVPK